MHHCINTDTLLQAQIFKKNGLSYLIRHMIVSYTPMKTYKWEIYITSTHISLWLLLLCETNKKRHHHISLYVEMYRFHSLHTYDKNTFFKTLSNTVQIFCQYMVKFSKDIAFNLITENEVTVFYTKPAGYCYVF